MEAPAAGGGRTPFPSPPPPWSHKDHGPKLSGLPSPDTSVEDKGLTGSLCS